MRLFYFDEDSAVDGHLRREFTAKFAEVFVLPQIADGSGAAYRRIVRAQHERVGNVEIEEIIEMLGVAGQHPFMGNAPNRRFAPAHFTP